MCMQRSTANGIAGCVAMISEISMSVKFRFLFLSLKFTIFCRCKTIFDKSEAGKPCFLLAEAPALNSESRETKGSGGLNPKPYKP